SCDSSMQLSHACQPTGLSPTILNVSSSHETQTPMAFQPTCLDLFCGIGGLTIGLERAGFRSVGGIDIWDDAARTFEHNLPHLRCFRADLSTLTVREIERFFDLQKGDVDLITGGPPCQGFSTVGKRDHRDPRNRLWQHYFELVSEIRPPYVLMENVEGMKVMAGGKLCEQIIRSFESIGYSMTAKLIRSADYGVPQLRKRLIFLGCLDGLTPPTFPQPSVNGWVTVGDAVFDLPPLQPGQRSERYTKAPMTPYQAARRKNVSKGDLRNHEAANHPPHLVELLSHIPDGGNRRSIPDHLQPRSGFHNSYARLASDKPAVAVTSNMRKPSSARATHPKQNRGLTVREGLRLQSFDDDYIVLGSRTSQYLQVGNAVPPLLAETIGRELMRAYSANVECVKRSASSAYSVDSSAENSSKRLIRSASRST
ncbi:MAG: DNA cytosine methyltransferase, partial [Planctomycetaceae bacterium]